MSRIKVGVYASPDIPQSFRVYAANVIRHLPGFGVDAIPFDRKENLPAQVDLLWDIRSGGGNAPLDFLLGGPPVVVTVHGFAPITLPGREYFGTLRGALTSRHHARAKLKQWRELGPRVSALIAVSEFTRSEIVSLTGFPGDRIGVCLHGVNSEYFSRDPGVGRGRYFLHISNDEPRKNLARVVRAFARFRKRQDVELVLKLPETQAGRYAGIDGVRVISGMLGTDELADLYRRALGFVFPSLYEGFGLPILEAMACGCPVITSSVTACPEVAGNAALLVDPRDEGAIFQAMEALASGRDDLVASGLERASRFTWQDSAQCHAGWFRRALGFERR